ncbi:MAG: hypothetical protein MK108_15305 [Mariniblastus sp.]|nr:hypothetical protein [Mariniblastus sp.]
MLRKLEMTWILMMVATCLMGTGCSSLFLPDGGEFSADNSRLVDMRPSNLESLVAESETQPLGSDEAVDLMVEESGSLPEVIADPPANGEVWQVNHEAEPVLEPLRIEVSPEEIARGEGQGISEKIIILKAKSTNPSSVDEMIEPSANPATPPAPITTGADPESGKSSPLAPISWGSDVSPVYSNFEPARLVCGTGCDCDDCQPVNASPEVVGDANEPGEAEPLPANEALPGGAEAEAVSDEAAETPGTDETEPEMAATTEATAEVAEAADNQFEPAPSEPQPASETAPAVKSEEAPPVSAAAGNGELVAAEPTNANAGNRVLSWDLQLKATITAFENQIIDLTLSDYRRPKLQQSLAILQALDDRLSSGRIALEQPKHRQYWQYQMTAVLNMLQAAKTNEEGGRENVAVAIAQLKSAVVELQQLSELSIARFEFCSEVSGYGQFVTMDHSEFLPGSKTLIYCEIENFAPVKEKVGEREMFATRLECQLEILDPEEKLVQAVDFPIVEDLAINHRRDFYMHLPLTLAQLPPGDYHVRLQVKDLGSQKSAHYPLPGLITIKP